MKVYKPTVFFILLFHASFINLPYVNGYGLYKYMILFIVGVFLLFQFRIFRQSEYRILNRWLLLYLFMILISSYINKNSVRERKVFLVAIIFVLTILEIYYLFEYFIILNHTQELIDTLFYLLLFYCVLTDIIMIIFPSLHIDKGRYYLIGNKFEVSYLHLQLLVMYMQKEKCNRRKWKFGKSDLFFWLLIIMSFLTCINIQCTTGMIGIVLLIIFYYCVSQKEKTLKNPMLFIIILFVSASVLMIFSGVVKLEPVKYLVEEVFHRDITLTGRLNIYESIDKVFAGHVLFGYGMGSSFEIVMKMIGAPNTQNGVLEIILQQGTISLILLVILIWKIFHYISQNRGINYALVMLYIYIILASVEITLDVSFLVWLVLALVFEKNTKKEFLYCKENRE